MWGSACRGLASRGNCSSFHARSPQPKRIFCSPEPRVLNLIANYQAAAQCPTRGEGHRRAGCRLLMQCVLMRSAPWGPWTRATSMLFSHYTIMHCPARTHRARRMLGRCRRSMLDQVASTAAAFRVRAAKAACFNGKLLDSNCSL